MKKYLEMFMTFFKIGAFTLGGGYAMVPLIEKEVVHNKNWIAKEDFIDMLALAQSSPGPIAVNTAVFVGYKVGGIPGCFFTTLGSILPSFTIILFIAMFFTNIQNNIFIEKAFKAIRPATVALIAVPVIRMGKSAKINKKTIIIPIVVTLLVAFVKVTPIIIIALSVLIGILFNSFKRR